MALAVSCSLMPLKSLMSEKKIVSVRRSAWSAPLPISRLTMRGIDELAEGVLDALARAQLLDHAIEGQRELADLVAREDRHRLRLRAGLDGPGAGDELAQAADHAGRSHGADAEADAAGAPGTGRSSARCRAAGSRGPCGWPDR